MIKSSKTMKIICNKDELWSAITNNNDYYWRSDLTKIKVIDDTHFIEYDKRNYPTNFTILSKKKLKEYILEFENTNLKGKWTGEFKEISNIEFELTFTEEIEPKNTLVKLLAKPYLNHKIKYYISDLESKLLGKESKSDKFSVIKDVILFIILYVIITIFFIITS